VKPLIETALLFALTLWAPIQAPHAAIKIGDKAPDFALPNGDGKLVALSEYTSRSPVVVLFYRGFW
jgi:peroxiredoxin